MNYYCNPTNLEYHYQLFKKKDVKNALCEAHREAADPSVVYFKGLYYLFPSMSAGFYTSENLDKWEFHEFLGSFPINDYAPDVRAIGEYLYCCASNSEHNCSFYRTRDPFTEPFEEIKGNFQFWDPNLFCDEDGRRYLYWGSSNTEPIYGIELDPETMHAIGEKTALIEAKEDRFGYERLGEDYLPPKTEEEIEAAIQEVIKQYGGQYGVGEDYEPDEAMKKQLYKWFGNSPYLEGPWMTKYQGKYYLQYAVTGTEYNVYADAVYVGDSPLGPFVPAKNNPYSYKPGGFITGAGHGSTFEDRENGFWHVSTMRISKHHSFERRIGIWKAEFDEQGELCCDQRYGDWPVKVEAKIWEKPDWMLLSYHKPVKASSGKGTECVTDENVRTWWRAETSGKEEWVELDLEDALEIHAVQINFADDCETMAQPEMNFVASFDTQRCIDTRKWTTRWILEGSKDGVSYEVLADKSKAETDLAHDFLVWESGREIRYLRLRAMELPYGQKPCVSGIRVFGLGKGEVPKQVEKCEIIWNQDDPMQSLDMTISWEQSDAVGYNILWGYEPEKLYHSYMVYEKAEQKIGALAKESPVYIRIDAFNENGITEGITRKVR